MRTLSRRMRCRTSFFVTARNAALMLQAGPSHLQRLDWLYGFDIAPEVRTGSVTDRATLEAATNLLAPAEASIQA